MTLDELLNSKQNKQKILDRLRDQYRDIIAMSRFDKHEPKLPGRIEGQTAYINEQELLEYFKDKMAQTNFSDDQMTEWLRENCPDNEYDSFGNVTNYTVPDSENIDDIYELITENNSPSVIRHIIEDDLEITFRTIFDFFGQFLGFTLDYNKNGMPYADFDNKETANMRHNAMYDALDKALDDLYALYFPSTVKVVIQDFFDHNGKYFKLWKGKKLKKVIEMFAEYLDSSTIPLAEKTCSDDMFLIEYLLNSAIEFDASGHPIHIDEEYYSEEDELTEHIQTEINSVTATLNNSPLMKNISVSEYSYDFGTTSLKYMYRMGSVFTGDIQISVNYDEIQDEFLGDPDEVITEATDYIKNRIYLGVAEYIVAMFLYNEEFRNITESHISQKKAKLLKKGYLVEIVENSELIDKIINIPELEKFSETGYENPNNTDYFEECKKWVPKILEQTKEKMKKEPLYKDIEIECTHEYKENDKVKNPIVLNFDAPDINKVLFIISYPLLAQNAKESNWTIDLLKRMISAFIYNTVFGHILLFLCRNFNIHNDARFRKLNYTQQTMLMNPTEYIKSHLNYCCYKEMYDDRMYLEENLYNLVKKLIEKRNYNAYK